MSELDTLKFEIKAMIVDSLNLEDTVPEDIQDDQALFGAGLELDSLDALQLAVALEERFGVTVTDEQMGEQVFASVSSMAEFVARTRGNA